MQKPFSEFFFISLGLQLLLGVQPYKLPQHHITLHYVREQLIKSRVRHSVIITWLLTDTNWPNTG